jgi:hypothetical protein
MAAYCTSISAGGENLDPAAAQKMWMESMGPFAADQGIRQAISMLWMMLPQEKKTLEQLEQEMRRLVDRALRDLKEDAQAFGIPLPSADSPQPV